MKFNPSFLGKTTRNMSPALIGVPMPPLCATKQDGSHSRPCSCAKHKHSALLVDKVLLGSGRDAFTSFSRILGCLQWQKNIVQNDQDWSFMLNVTSKMHFKMKRFCIHRCISSEAQSLNFRYHRVNSKNLFCICPPVNWGWGTAKAGEGAVQKSSYGLCLQIREDCYSAKS